MTTIHPGDALVAAALRDRKIAPHDAPRFRAMYDQDPDGTTRLLTAAVRHGGLLAGQVIGDARPQSEAYPAHWTAPFISSDRSAMHADD